MKSQKILEGKIWSLLTALTSGILTTLFCDTLSNTSYILQVTKNQTKIIPYNESIIQTYSIVFLIFIIIWGFISIFIPSILKVINRFHFKKIAKYSRKELLLNFNTNKEELLQLEILFFSDDNCNVKQHLIKLKIKELATIIVFLHKTFLPSNKRLKKYIKNVFRNPDHTSIINISDKISGYEFISLISIIEQMIILATNYVDNNVLLQRDCDEMQKMITELKHEYINP